MILSDIKDYLNEHGPTSLAELSQHFDSDPEAMRGMLDFWIARGRIVRQLPSCSSGCSQCAPETIELYSWMQRPSIAGIPIKPCPK